jgi:hypothetical protein
LLEQHVFMNNTRDYDNNRLKKEPGTIFIQFKLVIIVDQPSINQTPHILKGLMRGES